MAQQYIRRPLQNAAPPPGKEPPPRKPPPTRLGRLLLALESPRVRPFAIAVGALAMAGVVLAIATRMAGQGPAEVGVPVRVNVECNLPVRVSVRHGDGERKDSRHQLEVLGEEPRVLGLAGAHVGDRIALENAIQGAYYEYEIPYGQPGEEVVIRKRFDTGHVQFRIGRSEARELAVYRNEYQIAPYAADVKIALVEGPHTLEIRGAGLRRPAKVAVEVRAGEVTLVDPPPLALERDFAPAPTGR